MWLVTAAQVKLQIRGGRILHRWKHLDQGVAKIARVRIGELSPALTRRAKGSKLRGAEHLALGSETWKAGSSSPAPWLLSPQSSAENASGTHTALQNRNRVQHFNLVQAENNYGHYINKFVR